MFISLNMIECDINMYNRLSKSEFNLLIPYAMWQIILRTEFQFTCKFNMGYIKSNFSKILTSPDQIKNGFRQYK